MSAAYTTISCIRGEIRKYGGNRSDVRAMYNRYLKMTKEEFLTKHPYLLVEDYLSLRVTFTRKNR